VQILLKRVPERRDAVLPGFRRHRIQQQVFPAMAVGGNDDEVHGQVRHCRVNSIHDRRAGLAQQADIFASLLQVLCGLSDAELNILVS